VTHHYILDPDNQVVPVASFADYWRWLGAERKARDQELPVATLQVARDTWGDRPDCASTVFLGLDHNFGQGPLQVFETMLFTDGDDDESLWRYATWDEAVAGHARVVAAARTGEAGR